MHNSLFFGILAFALFSCMGKAEKQKEAENKNSYDLSKPQKVYELSKELKEISGIEYMPDNSIACIQDEDGEIFIYNLSTSQIDRSIPFAEKGDYEEIAKVGEDFFVLRSDGTVFHKQPNQTKTYDTPLSDKDDTESLCFDKYNDRLIIGSKKGHKSFYAFSLENFSLAKAPLFSINDKKFNPTAVEIHPQTQEFYVLSKERIFIFSKEGTLKEQLDLDPSLFSQAEGISFKEDGTLFISNEANDAKATILEFNYHSYGH